jgi:hypothetical protein
MLRYSQRLFMFSFIFILLFVPKSFAQKAAVTEIPLEGSTTITVQKGAANSGSTEMSQILDGNAEISGEPNVLSRGARDSWKKSCDDWKDEVKALNKENQLIAINCNSPSCNAMNGSTTCKSIATYKVKVNLKK